MDNKMKKKSLIATILVILLFLMSGYRLANGQYYYYCQDGSCVQQAGPEQEAEHEAAKVSAEAKTIISDAITGAIEKAGNDLVDKAGSVMSEAKNELITYLKQIAIKIVLTAASIFAGICYAGVLAEKIRNKIKGGKSD